jgi:polysaccharide biosynthesis/export protein
MRLPCVSVFSLYPFLQRMNRLLVGGHALLFIFLFMPSAWSQSTAQNSAQSSSQNSGRSSGQSVVVNPSDPHDVGTTTETNDRITQMALAESGKKGDYILGSGDLLGIEVFDVPELTRDVRVSESGFISLPLLPIKVRTAGLTAFQMQDKLAELLLANGLVSNPQVTVSVKEQHGEPITVMGAVRTPMVIQAVRQMTLLEVLSRVGGIADDAGGVVLISRPAHAVVLDSPASEPLESAPSTPEELTAPLRLRVDLHDLLDTGDSKYNLALRGGDVVSVHRAGVVYAVGAVQRPGGYVMANDRQQLTVLKVLALSGGLTSTAKLKNAVIIRGSAESDRRQVPVDLERILAFKAEDIELQQSDILFVPNSSGKQVMGRVAQTALGLASGVALVRLGN